MRSNYEVNQKTRTTLAERVRARARNTPELEALGSILPKGHDRQVAHEPGKKKKKKAKLCGLAQRGPNLQEATLRGFAHDYKACGTRTPVSAAPSVFVQVN